MLSNFFWSTTKWKEGLKIKAPPLYAWPRPFPPTIEYQHFHCNWRVCKVSWLFSKVQDLKTAFVCVTPYILLKIKHFLAGKQELCYCFHEVLAPRQELCSCFQARTSFLLPSKNLWSMDSYIWVNYCRVQMSSEEPFDSLYQSGAIIDRPEGHQFSDPGGIVTQ